MNNREKAELDRYITGNYGEDQFRDQEERTSDDILFDIMEFIEAYVIDMTDSGGRSLLVDFSDLRQEANDYLESQS